MIRRISTILLLFTMAIVAQEPFTTLFGQQWLNGRGWHMLDAKAKVLYVTAFNEGSGIAIINWLTTAKIKPTTEEFTRQESFYTSDAAFSADDTVDQIDRFYSSDANLNIPVVHAVLWSIYKFRGASPRELEAYTTRLRSMVTERSGHSAPPIKSR